MTVINPNSISGITSITLPSGDGNVLTIHTNDGVERFRIDSSGNVKVGSAATISPDGDVFFTGVTTATTFTGAHSGSGANLTSLPAAQLSGTLPALDGSALTGVASTENIRTNTNATFLQNINVSGITTVGSAVTISESGIEASGIGITCANINGGQIAGRRNIAINGAMEVNQRGTVTGITNNASSYGGPDRFKTTVINHGTYTTSQEYDAPEGFTKSLKVNTTSADSDLASNARLYVQHKIEKQDLIHLRKGTSNAKQLTVQFYVKSNKTGTYILELFDNINNRHVSSTYTISSSATWEQKIITFPADTGGSAFDGSNPTNTGIEFNWWLAAGSAFTSGSLATTWTGNNDPKRVAGITVNVGDSGYWQITGVQIEAGAHATAFEHRPVSEELALCERYCQVIVRGQQYFGTCMLYTSSTHTSAFLWKKTMRSTPTIVANSGGDYYITYRNNSGNTYNSLDGSLSLANENGGGVYTTNGSGTQGHAGTMGGANNNTLVYIEAEL